MVQLIGAGQLIKFRSYTLKVALRLTEEIQAINCLYPMPYFMSGTLLLDGLFSKK